MDPIVLEEVELTAEHQPTGNTRHLRSGALLGPPIKLRIVRYPDEVGYKLRYLDAVDTPRGRGLTRGPGRLSRGT